MDEMISVFMQSLPTVALVLIALISLYTLGKGADFLVEEAVSLSELWGIPKMIIGATIVSLGTTLPEVSVSVLAAISGNADLALGNSIGSIIVDTGLILGLTAILGNLIVDKNIINRQGRIQLGAAALLTIFALPIFGKNGNGIIYQWMGILFLIILVIYIYFSIKWSKKENEKREEDKNTDHTSKPVTLLFKIILGISLVIVSSKILIPAVEISALRVGIPESIIAATLVAFGTSLPELMTAISSVRKGHGDLAVGNIIGADILNVLFVTGAAAAFTPKGLFVPSNFYTLQFPAMLIILILFRVFAKQKRSMIVRWQGIILLSAYGIYLIFNYVM